MQHVEGGSGGGGGGNGGGGGSARIAESRSTVPGFHGAMGLGKGLGKGGGGMGGYPRHNEMGYGMYHPSVPPPPHPMDRDMHEMHDWSHFAPSSMQVSDFFLNLLWCVSFPFFHSRPSNLFHKYIDR